MIMMTGMTFDAMLLQLTDWRTEREHVVVRHAGRALLRRCEALHLARARTSDALEGASRGVSRVASMGDPPSAPLATALGIQLADRAVPECDESASWTPLHDAMRTTTPPARWRVRRALSTHAKGTRRLTWTVARPATNARIARHPPQWIVDAVCLPEKWIDDSKIGRVDVLTVHAQMRHAGKSDGVHEPEAGVWLQSIVARRPAPCHRTVRALREIVAQRRRETQAR